MEPQLLKALHLHLSERAVGEVVEGGTAPQAERGLDLTVAK